MDKISIMLVDDQMLLREGLKTIINLQEDMEVVAEAEQGKMAIEHMKKNPVDVILMDIQMPILDGVEATTIIKKDYPETTIIILTTFDDDDYIIDALSNGAAGYLLKDIDAGRLTQSIRDAQQGQMMLPSRIAAKLAARLAAQNVHGSGMRQQPRPDTRLQLSQREQEIGALIAQGLSNRQIAQTLFLTEGTIKNYISEIYAKLGTNDRTRASILLKKILED